MEVSEKIKISTESRIRKIVLNRPEKKNALDLEMYNALADAMLAANDDEDVRVIYITGTADSLCSGNDIQDFLKSPPTGENSPVFRFIQAIVHAEKPIVAAVNGLAVGIGTTMLLHCDLVYASDQARFQVPFVNIGICPEAGSTFLLPLLVGYQKAAEWLFLGGMFDANAAREAGIVTAVVPAAELEQVAMKAAARVAAQPPNSVKVTKGLLRTGLKDAMMAAVDRENRNFVPMLDLPEAQEALNAFLEKRKPDFSKF